MPSSHNSSCPPCCTPSTSRKTPTCASWSPPAPPHKDTWGKGLDFSTVKDANAYGSALKRYGHSKLANVLFARGLAQHYPDITSTSYHPGVVKTEIWNKDAAHPWLGAIARPFVALLGRSVENGCLDGFVPGDAEGD